MFRVSNHPVEILEIRIEFMQNLWLSCNDIQAKIEELDETDDEGIVIDERYCLLIGRAALVNFKQPHISKLMNRIMNRFTAKTIAAIATGVSIKRMNSRSNCRL